MKDYWDDRFFCLALWCSFGGRKQLLPELVLGVWLPAWESSFPCIWVDMLGPVASDLPRHTSLLGPWAGNLEGDGSFAIRRAVDLSGAVDLHLFPETSWVCLCYSLPVSSHFSSAVLHSKFLCVHLIIWTSYSAPKWCALKIISHSPPQHCATASLYSWLLILHLASQTLKPNVFSCLNLPMGANEKKQSWFTNISSRKVTLHQYLFGWWGIHQQARHWLDLSLKGWMSGLILDW